MGQAAVLLVLYCPSPLWWGEEADIFLTTPLFLTFVCHFILDLSSKNHTAFGYFKIQHESLYLLI